ncbi:MAG TPA: anthranilate synthase component I family protein [Flavobacteriaceae bacterium]|nr:anthranilate synthase component I family protein [Flavobacteriaceae bacterium]
MKKIKFNTISKKQLADTLTPVGLYAKIRDKFQNSLLLESSDYHSKEDSFTYICIKPIITLKANNNKFVYTVNNKTIDSKVIDNNFYEIFETYKKTVDVNCNENLKKVNGFYGYVAYDAVTYFENIKLKAKEATSAIPHFQFSFFQFIIAINHFNDELQIIENIEEGKTSEIHQIETLINASNFGLFNFEVTSEERSNCTDTAFKNNVTKAKQHCKRGDVFQLVLSRQFQQNFKGDDFNVYRALRSINPSPYLFYFDYGNFKLFGSSPEAQIKIEKNKALINPIAGTFKRTGNMAKDLELGKKLAADKKENAEHVMLVDLARNDLSKHAKNVEVNVFKEVQYFSHVIHLVSTVQGKPFGKAIEIVGDTFPAGTLSGAPKYKAMELIDKYENQTRGFYGGAVGFIGLDNQVNLAIAIRSFVSKHNTLYYQAGAGIVINSKEEKELQEVNNKLAALKKALLLAEKI